MDRRRLFLQRREDRRHHLHGADLYPTDSGATWTARDSDRQWQAVASSADGVKLVAVVYGSSSRIYTSTNSGVDWTPTGPTNLNWSSVASSADGTRL